MDIARKRARLGESAAHFRRWGTPSPDGRWILFVHVYPHSRYVSPPIDLWVTGIDGRHVRRLVEPTPNGPSYTWTPDGLVSVAHKAQGCSTNMTGRRFGARGLTGAEWLPGGRRLVTTALGRAVSPGSSTATMRFA